ncbi:MULTISPECIES: DUF3991 and toprim domain-containing protein [Bradyrhizobium]|uniref:DUF3991 and toprim domain-containing protein n=2 Tax=Bradyrhizobium quebecense TaxID=2748629 RepID=A0ACD3VP49_9BRAD|nr:MULTISPECIES: DUF3991 and toprim domain-containing protein [Bradyrhizobium]UFX49449.1 DUF3991 and toprim domain-containing protein [Bradyrhizobium sp. 41S5]UGY07542.1 DUF3991 and toprim domain-containing protein [Bradyrhizobium quebecense]
MDKREIEELRQKVGCAALLEKDGWKVDVKESTRRAIKYRRDSNIIIVIHEGRGWFDPLSPAKGDVFSLAEHLGSVGFLDACDRVAEMIGFVPSTPAWQHPTTPKALGSIAERWGHRVKPRPGSRAWRYLTDERGLPADIVRQAVVCDRLREGPKGSMWAAHSDSAGVLTGWEERGPAWRGFASDGAKELFRFGPARSERICITEAAIDAMSLAAIEVHRSDTLYVSTGGGWSPATDEAIRSLAMRANARLVAATDNNRQGDVYADRVRAIAAEASVHYARSRPCAGDWNEDLTGLAKRRRTAEQVDGGGPPDAADLAGGCGVKAPA